LRHQLNEKVSIMLLSPEEYIPAEVARRTTLAAQAFRAQPRRTVRRRRFALLRRNRDRRYTLAA
jgi:hypothetical protein